MPYAKREDLLAYRRKRKASAIGKAESKRYRQKLKQTVLRAYGGVCACCDEDRIEFLGIDHINGGGRKHRTALKISGGWNFYQWLKTNFFPKGYRVLCHNCNISLGVFGYCPHTLAKAPRRTAPSMMRAAGGAITQAPPRPRNRALATLVGAP
jgi:hypothetical protein